jgi:hypothetical protein
MIILKGIFAHMMFDRECFLMVLYCAQGWNMTDMRSEEVKAVSKEEEADFVASATSFPMG